MLMFTHSPTTGLSYTIPFQGIFCLCLQLSIYYMKLSASSFRKTGYTYIHFTAAYNQLITGFLLTHYIHLILQQQPISVLQPNFKMVPLSPAVSCDFRLSCCRPPPPHPPPPHPPPFITSSARRANPKTSSHLPFIPSPHQIQIFSIITSV